MATARVLYLYSELDCNFDNLVMRFGGEFSEPPVASDVRQVAGDPSQFRQM
jgi:hypothetical protein